ncbi:MAG: carbon-nitrogen hydrolase family protein [Bacillota bacterium]
MERTGTQRTLRVAAIQVRSMPGCIEANHAHATPCIERAARDGAELIVLPELFACGYIPNRTIWDFAEPKDGPTVTWLKRLSGRLGVYVGAGFVETDGVNFFNAFVITAPDREVAGRARKANAESYCFSRGKGCHIIDTAIGRLAVGICADNHFTSFLKQVQADSVDLMVMPDAWPTPYRVSKLVSAADLLRINEEVKALALLYACHLGVPVVLVNPVGPMEPRAGLFGKVMDPGVFSLRGMSRIVDSDGTLRGELGDEEGVLVSDVTLDPAMKRSLEPRDFGGWLYPGPAMVRRVLLPAENAVATLSYKLSPKRRKTASMWSHRAG